MLNAIACVWHKVASLVHYSRAISPLKAGFKRALLLFLVTLSGVTFLIFSYEVHAAWWNPVSSAINLGKEALGGVGSVFGAGAGGFLESATAPTIDHMENSCSRVVEKLDGSLGMRLKELDTFAGKRIGDFNAVLEDRIGQLNSDISKRIKELDADLNARISQIDGVLSASIADVDEVLRKRLEQLDEMTEKRIGNLDTVATKATFSMESAMTRIIGAGCLMVFLAAAFWRMYVEGSKVWDGIRSRSENWSSRFSELVSKTWVKISGQVALMGTALLVLFLLFSYFPGGARRRTQQLAKLHRDAYSSSLATLDLQQAFYHASQLQVLDSASDENRGFTQKADLLRDIFTRPGLLQSAAGIRGILIKLNGVDNLLGEGKDPDILAIKGFLLWRTGASKKNEHQAAAFCAEALKQTAGKPFALKPLAITYLNNYLCAPLPNRLVTPVQDMTIEEMRGIAKKNSSSAEISPTFPLIYLVKYDEFVRDLSQSSLLAYVDMLDQQAAFLFSKEPERKNAARTGRTQKAESIKLRWSNFQEKLNNPSLFEGTMAPLAAFFLNDAICSRGVIYTADTQLETAPNVASIGIDKRPAVVAALPRVAMEKKYGRLIPKTSRDLVDFQESRRFINDETQLLAFESAYVNFKKGTYGETSLNDVMHYGMAAAKLAAECGLVDYQEGVAKPLADTIFEQTRAYCNGVIPETEDRKQYYRQQQQDIDAQLMKRRLSFL